jgi:hypothetical protein
MCRRPKQAPGYHQLWCQFTAECCTLSGRHVLCSRALWVRILARSAASVIYYVFAVVLLGHLAVQFA